MTTTNHGSPLPPASDAPAPTRETGCPVCDGWTFPDHVRADGTPVCGKHKDRVPAPRSGDGDPTPPELKAAYVSGYLAGFATGQSEPGLSGDDVFGAAAHAARQYDAAAPIRSCECSHADDWHEGEPPYPCIKSGCSCKAFRLRNPALASQRAARARAEQDAARYRELRRLLFEDMAEVERLRCLSPSRVDAYLSIPKLTLNGGGPDVQPR